MLFRENSTKLRPLLFHTAFRIIWTALSSYVTCNTQTVTKGPAELFVANRQIHTCNTRQHLDLHLPSTHLTVVLKGVLYSGCKIFNSLPIQIKNHIDNLQHFKKFLKNYLLRQTLYSLDEYYQQLTD